MPHFLSSSFANYPESLKSARPHQGTAVKQKHAAVLLRCLSKPGLLPCRVHQHLRNAVFLHILVCNTWNTWSPIKISDKRTRALLWYQASCADEEFPLKKQNSAQFQCEHSAPDGGAGMAPGWDMVQISAHQIYWEVLRFGFGQRHRTNRNCDCSVSLFK